MSMHEVEQLIQKLHIGMQTAGFRPDPAVLQEVYEFDAIASQAKLAYDRGFDRFECARYVRPAGHEQCVMELHKRGTIPGDDGSVEMHDVVSSWCHS